MTRGGVGRPASTGPPEYGMDATHAWFDARMFDARMFDVPAFDAAVLDAGRSR